VVAPSLGSRPIGYIKTSFPTKNGCPRQGTICEHARAKLTVEFGTNPQYSLDGLADFSHVWLLFLFSDNGASHSPRAKVLPPRLRGKAKGVFATRAPHRPNPIGLTLARLDSVDGATLELSALDLVDGTPVLDVKPFISAYDTPACGDVRCPTWCLPREETLLGVRVSDAARLDLADIKASAERPRLARSWSEALTGLCEVLVQDPRSTYRRDKCGDERYPIYFDRLKAWCAFGTEGEQETVEVLSLSVERPPRK
jgi:tRNA-Thr(GGU) m(6)t(6)A37 methyltransferase TsaA